MRTITKTVYTFNELSKDAQRIAYEKWLSNTYYPWYDENEDSLREFCKTMSIDFSRVNYEYGGRDYISFSMPDFEHEAVKVMTGQRLATYLLNNYAGKFMAGEYYSLPGKWIDGKYHARARRSRITKTWQDCPLTGYGVDYCLLKPLFDFIDDPRKYGQWGIADVFNACLKNWLGAVGDDREGYFSFENFKENYTDDVEFYENGEVA